MSKTRSDLSEVNLGVLRAMSHIRSRLDASNNLDDDALAVVEGYLAIAMKVMAGVNPSKIKSATRTVEIGMRLGGRPESTPF